MFSVTYGQKIDEMDHDYVLTAQVAIEGLSEATALGKYWALEAFPFLRHIPTWVPWTSARRVAEKYAPIVMLARDKPFQEVELQMVCVMLFRRRVSYVLIIAVHTQA